MEQQFAPGFGDLREAARILTALKEQYTTQFLNNEMPVEDTLTALVALNRAIGAIKDKHDELLAIYEAGSMWVGNEDEPDHVGGY